MKKNLFKIGLVLLVIIGLKYIHDYPGNNYATQIRFKLTEVTIDVPELLNKIPAFLDKWSLKLKEFTGDVLEEHFGVEGIESTEEIDYE